jgi:hypothetical protein
MRIVAAQVVRDGRVLPRVVSWVPPRIAMMKNLPAILGIALFVAACSGSNTSAPPAAPAVPSQADKELAMYRELVQARNYELAGPIGEEIVGRFPGTPAADEVRKTLADVTAQGRAKADARRLERLWIYQSGNESGGRQNTASIYSSDRSTGDRVRLVLRRHSDWGQSAYLYGGRFVCARSCTIAARFDDAPVRKLRAHLPETGEPALFIDDDRDFIARLAKARTIAIDVVEKSRGERHLVFEVGGYDAAKFPPLGRGK